MHTSLSKNEVHHTKITGVAQTVGLMGESVDVQEGWNPDIRLGRQGATQLGFDMLRDCGIALCSDCIWIWGVLHQLKVLFASYVFQQLFEHPEAAN